MPNESLNLYFTIKDGGSPTLSRIGDKTRALDKESQRLEQSLTALEKANRPLIQRQSELTSELSKVKVQAKEAEQEFKRLGNTASEDKYRKAVAHQEELKAKIRQTTEEIRQNERQFRTYADTIRRESSGAGSFGIADLGRGLVQAGIGRQLGQAAGSLIQAGLGSAIGGDQASFLSQIVNGGISGGAMGYMMGPWGAAAGGLIGAISGGIQAKAQHFSKEDDAFKSYVQEQVTNQLAEQERSKTEGSAIAAQREKDKISFSTLFRSQETAEDYLGGLVDMANNTPFLYGDLTAMSKTLATYQYGANEIIPVLQTIGDTGAALGHTTQDMMMVGTALGRMKSSGKASLDYLNMLSDRGIGAVGMLADAKGVSQGKMYEMISKGEIAGNEASQIILNAMAESFSGSMLEQSKTFGGLISTVEGLHQELDAARGEGYNEERKKSLMADRDRLSGESGERQKTIQRALGAWQASLENAKDEYIRKAEDSVMRSFEFRIAEAMGNQKEMGKLLMEAKIQGMNEYNSHEGADEALAQELSLIKAVQENTAADRAMWDAGRRRGEAYSKGMLSAIKGGYLAMDGEDLAAAWEENQGGGTPLYQQNEGPKVPAPVLLKIISEDILNNQPPVVHIHDPVIRETADVNKVVATIMDQINLCKLGGVQSRVTGGRGR